MMAMHGRATVPSLLLKDGCNQRMVPGYSCWNAVRGSSVVVLGNIKPHDIVTVVGRLADFSTPYFCRTFEVAEFSKVTFKYGAPKILGHARRQISDHLFLKQHAHGI